VYIASRVACRKNFPGRYYAGRFFYVLERPGDFFGSLTGSAIPSARRQRHFKIIQEGKRFVGILFKSHRRAKSGSVLRRNKTRIKCERASTRHPPRRMRSQLRGGNCGRTRGMRPEGAAQRCQALVFSQGPESRTVRPRRKEKADGPAPEQNHHVVVEGEKCFYCFFLSARIVAIQRGNRGLGPDGQYRFATRPKIRRTRGIVGPRAALAKAVGQAGKTAAPPHAAQGKKQDLALLYQRGSPCSSATVAA